MNNRRLIVFLLFLFILFAPQGASADVTMTVGGIPRTSPYKTGAATVNFNFILTAAQAVAAAFPSSGNCTNDINGDGTVYGSGETYAYPFNKNQSYSYNGAIGVFTRGFTCYHPAHMAQYFSTLTFPPIPSGWSRGLPVYYSQGKTYYNYPTYTPTTSTFSAGQFASGQCPAGTVLGTATYSPNSQWFGTDPSYGTGQGVILPDEKTAFSTWASAYCNQFAGANCCEVTPDVTYPVLFPMLGCDVSCSGASAYQPLQIRAVQTTGTSLVTQYVSGSGTWPWSSLQAPTTPTAVLSANPSSVSSGGTSLLTYSCTNSTSASIDQGVGSVTPVSGGSITTSAVTTSTTYTLTCSGTGGSAQASTTVTLLAPQCSDGANNDGDAYTDYPNDPGCTDALDDSEDPNPPTPPTATLSASPSSIPTGSSSTLTWSSTNATSCSGTGFATGGATGGSVSTDALIANTNYQVSCTGPGGSANDATTVSVTTPTGDLSGNPDRVNQGDTTTITWACTAGATTGQVTGTNGFSQSGLSGTAVSTGIIATQTIFTLTCDGVDVDTLIINVTPAFEEF